VALNPKNALETARNIWAGPRLAEAQRLNFIAAAVNPRRAYASNMGLPMTQLGLGHPTVEMPKDAPPVMRNLAWKSRTNFLPLILDTFAQVMKADGYLEANGKQSDAWKYWQSNGMDARQTGIHRAALQYGASYATVLPGDSGPVIRGYSPRRMTAIYADPTIDDWPMTALDVNGTLLKLYDEEMVYSIGIEHNPVSGLGAPQLLRIPDGTSWHFIEANAHGLGYCPVVRYRDRMLLDGEEQFGIIEPLVDIQRRVDETSFGMLVAQYYQAFKQRYVIGWVPKSEQEALEASASNLWAFKDETVKVGTLDGATPDPYIASKDSALSDMAAIAQVSASTLGEASKGRSNVSAEAVAAMDAGKDRKGSEIKTSFGESHELLLRACASIDGDAAAADDLSSQIRWRDMTTISPGAIIDALGKMQSMLGIPAEMLWTRVPGWTDQDQARAVEIIQSGDSLDKLMVTLGKQQMPGTQQAGDVPSPDGGGSTVGLGTN